MADPVLTEGQFDLGGFTFGGDADAVTVMPEGFDPGVTAQRVQDSDNPLGDSTMFGRDLFSPGSWTWNLQTNQLSAASALDAMETLAGLWQGDSVRSTPGAVLPIRYNIGKGARRVYGRPRRWAPKIDHRLWQGASEIVADFKLVDTLFYDDQLRTADISIVPGTGVGLKTPLVSPLTTVKGGDRERFVSDVGGTTRAPFVAVIYGPITRPWLASAGWRLDLDVSLSFDQFLTIDTRPWANRVTHSSGASLGGSLSRTSRLSDARLVPSGSTVKFGGTDLTGTAHCALSWRPTYRSI